MSTTLAAPAQYTPEDLLSMPDGDCFELIDDQLVERNMGAESSWVGLRLGSRLSQHGDENNLGWALPADNGYQCFPHAPGVVRRPDVSFIRFGRLPGGVLPKGWIKIAPDLVVEIVSPHDIAEDLEERLCDYEKARVPLVWVIYPRSRTVMVYRGGGPALRLHEHDELSGEDVLPGFRCALSDLWPRREPEVPQAAPLPPANDTQGTSQA